MHNDNGSPTVTNCTLTRNSAGSIGGGMYNFASSPTLTNCTFSGNAADLFDGGGMKNSLSDPTLINCTFSGNRANTSGGAICNSDSSSPAMTNCTLSGNSADSDGGGIYNSALGTNSPTLGNCILWGNVDDADGGSGGPFTDESAQIHTVSGAPTVDYSVVQGLTGGLGGTGNIGSDPLFIDADGADDIAGTPDDDLRLGEGSPAIDAADTTALPADVADLDGDGNTSERVPYDLDGMPRVLNDPDTPDTGVPGSAVVEMGAYEFITDCNENGVPDYCDGDCAASGGACNLPGCGQSADCNSNDILDECDIADCVANPDCDDCNLNGVPDSCDIAGPTSHDVDADEVPDECISPTTNGSSQDWTDGTNWDLGGNYPDNVDSAQNQYVTLKSTDDIFLDETVEIQSLRLLDDANLSVTQAGTGDLVISTAGGIYAEGNLLVANDREIDASAGLVTIGQTGKYIADPAEDNVSASLTAAGVAILEGDCDANIHSGEMNLDDTMSVSVSGDFIIDGLPAPCGVLANTSQGGAAQPQQAMAIRTCASALGSAASALGIIIPPKLSACGSGRPLTRTAIPLPGAVLTVNGDLTFLQAVYTVTEASETEDNRIILRGDFNHYATYPSWFNWSEGLIVLDGAGLQVIEVAGLDLGETLEGFLTDQDTLFDTDDHTNFSMGTLRVGTDSEPATVRFVNNFANTAGSGPCEEALYVDTLVLEAGSTVIVSDCRLYYNQAEDYGANVILEGCGDLVCLSAPSTPTLETLGKLGEPLNRKNRFISITGTDAGRQQAIRVVVGPEDAGRGAIPPPFDSWQYQEYYAGEPRAYCENAGQGSSVGPNPDVPGVSASPCGPSLGVYENGQDWFWAAPLVCDSANAHFMDWGTLANHCNTPGAAALDGYLCTVDADCQNACSFSGGGLYVGGSSSSPRLTNCDFIGNTFATSGSEDCGGGMISDRGSPTLVNCVFSGNTGRHGGGFCRNHDGEPTLINCTFSKNSVSGRGGGIFIGRENYQHRVTLIDCILWDNKDQQGTLSDESAQIDWGGR